MGDATISVDYITSQSGSISGSTFFGIGGGVPVSFFDENEPEVSGGWLVSSSPVPEPCTMLLVGSGLLGLLACRNRFLKV